MSREFRNENDAEERAVRQNQRVFQYLPPKVLQHTSLEDFDPDMTDFYGSDGTDSHWALSFIPLSAFSIPAELILRLKALLIINPIDTMSIYLSIQAASLSLRIKESMNLDAEGYAHGTTGRLKHPVPMIDFEVFILYFSHFILWHRV
jgi:hypothetical protein